MSGCTSCKSKGGCDSRKGDQREVLDEAIARVYPDRTWGRPDDEARFGAGLGREEARRLSRRLGAAVQAPVYFRRGADEDLCDYAWVLCVGRTPSLLEVREGRAEAEAGRIEEKYLRVAFSSVARIAAAQEVSLTLEGLDEGEAPRDAWGRPLDPALVSPEVSLVRESPRPGVFDPILLARLQKLVAFLEASDVRHIDFGLLDRALEGGLPGDYAERYGAEPRLANYLFQAAPPTASTVTLVQRAAGPRSALTA